MTTDRMTTNIASGIITATADNFMADVVTASADVPVLVDFWAPWCGPCRQLMPTLERLVTEYGGRFKLAKVNTDEQQELAQQVGIRSLPTVVLFKNGTAVDHFSGVVPEAQIRQMLDKHLPKLSDGPLARIQALKNEGDFAGARILIKQQLVSDPESVSLQTELAELQVLEGDLEGARQELDKLAAKEPNHAAVKRLAALLEFSHVIALHPDVRNLKERAASEADNFDLRHALAVHQLLGGDVEPALETWLGIMREDRGFENDLGRRSLVMAFELIGEADPIVARTRRAMSRLLF